LQAKNEQLLEQFENFLQQAEQLSPENNDAIEKASKQIDLYQLFSELSALKTEVKKEARQQKETITHFTKILDTLQNSNNQLTQELGKAESQRKNAIIQAKKDLLEGVIDLNDRLEATLISMENFKPPFMERKASREFHKGVQQGLAMTLRRVEQLLNSHDITPVKAIGKAVNPHTMRVTELKEEVKQPDGIVLEEIRRGYLHQGKLFRLAEVVANKHHNNEKEIHSNAK